MQREEKGSVKIWVLDIAAISSDESDTEETYAVISYILNFYVHMLIKGAVVLIIIITAKIAHQSQNTHYM